MKQALSLSKGKSAFSQRKDKGVQDTGPSPGELEEYFLPTKDVVAHRMEGFVDINLSAPGRGG